MNYTKKGDEIIRTIPEQVIPEKKEAVSIDEALRIIEVRNAELRQLEKEEKEIVDRKIIVTKERDDLMLLTATTTK